METKWARSCELGHAEAAHAEIELMTPTTPSESPECPSVSHA